MSLSLFQLRASMNLGQTSMFEDEIQHLTDKTDASRRYRYTLSWKIFDFFWGLQVIRTWYANSYEILM